MARRPGGYKKSDSTEWAECARSMYGEAVVSANSLGQDVYTWMNDAIAHHVYRVRLLNARERYEADMAEAIRTNGISPQQWEARYQVTDPKPEITRRPGQGSGSGPTGNSYKP